MNIMPTNHLRAFMPVDLLNTAIKEVQLGLKLCENEAFNRLDETIRSVKKSCGNRGDLVHDLGMIGITEKTNTAIADIIY